MQLYTYGNTNLPSPNNLAVDKVLIDRGYKPVEKQIHPDYVMWFSDNKL